MPDELEGGAVQLTLAWVLPVVAVTPVGAPGAPIVTALELPGCPVPTFVVAVTWNV